MYSRPTILIILAWVISLIFASSLYIVAGLALLAIVAICLEIYIDYHRQEI